MSEHADACPVCYPADIDAAPPVTEEPATGGGTLTTHECASCLTAWTTLWGADGWPVTRRLEPVSSERAAENMAVLAEALLEQDREREHARRSAA